MSKGLNQIAGPTRFEIVKHRVESKTGGLGYWGAVDALERIEQRKAEIFRNEQAVLNAKPLPYTKEIAKEFYD